MPEMHAVLSVAIACLLTAALRFAPFLIFGTRRQPPPLILYLGRVLPYAVMAMLVVYCLRGVGFSATADWLPTLLGVLVVVGLHLWRRNTLLSIVGGTLTYMLLLHFVF